MSWSRMTSTALLAVVLALICAFPALSAVVTIRDGQPTNFNGNNTMIYGTDQLVKYATVKIEVSASNSSLPATLKAERCDDYIGTCTSTVDACSIETSLCAWRNDALFSFDVVSEGDYNVTVTKFDVTPQQLSFTASGGSVDLQVSGTQELYLIIDSIPPAATLSGKIVTFGVTANLSAGSGPVAAYIRKEGFYSAFGSKAGVDVCSFDYNTTTAVPIPVVELTPTGCNTTLSYQITFRSLNSNASEIVPFSFVYSARTATPIMLPKNSTGSFALEAKKHTVFQYQYPSATASMSYSKLTFDTANASVFTPRLFWNAWNPRTKDCPGTGAKALVSNFESCDFVNNNMYFSAVPNVIDASEPFNLTYESVLTTVTPLDLTFDSRTPPVGGVTDTSGLQFYKLPTITALNGDKYRFQFRNTDAIGIPSVPTVYFSTNAITVGGPCSQYAKTFITPYTDAPTMDLPFCMLASNPVNAALYMTLKNFKAGYDITLSPLATVAARNVSLGATVTGSVTPYQRDIITLPDLTTKLVQIKLSQDVGGTIGLKYMHMQHPGCGIRDVDNQAATTTPFCPRAGESLMVVNPGTATSSVGYSISLVELDPAVIQGNNWVDEKWLRYDVASGIDAMSVDVFPQVNPVEVAIWGACTRIYSITCAANTLCQLPFDTNATRSVSVLFIKITPQVGKTTRTRVSVSYGINVCQDISNQTADVKFCMDSLDLTATYSIRTRLSALDAYAESLYKSYVGIQEIQSGCAATLKKTICRSQFLPCNPNGFLISLCNDTCKSMMGQCINSYCRNELCSALTLCATYSPPVITPGNGYVPPSPTSNGTVPENAASSPLPPCILLLAAALAFFLQ